jgi:hypothetical protein
MDLATVQSMVLSGRTTWISRVQWEQLLHASRQIYARIEGQRARGRSADHLWDELRPLNQTIRSARLKVHGIDDRALATGERTA